MANIFDSLKHYPGSWFESARRNFNEAEIEEVNNAFVVDSQYGKSVCFVMKTGGTSYIPLSTKSNVGIGETVQLADIQLVTLSRQGSDDIIRVEYNNE